MLSFKIRANFKIANWHQFLICRDIEFLVATFSNLSGTSHPLVVRANVPLCVMMSRQLLFRGISLVATSALKLLLQRAFHHLATLKFSASKKSILHRRNLNMVRNASLFSLNPSCELLKLSRSCSSLLFFAFFFVGVFCNIDRNDLIKQNSSPILIANKSKRLLTKIQNLKLKIPIFYGLPPISCSVLSP